MEFLKNRLNWIKRKFGNNDLEFILIVLILFSLLGGLGGSFLRAVLFQDMTPILFFTILLEAIGTIATLLLIWLTVMEGRKGRLILIEQARADRQEVKKDRQQLIEENLKTRLAAHLSEQLDFYSELKGGFAPLTTLDEYPDHPKHIIGEYYDVFSNLMITSKIASRYEKWATKELRRLLARYFTFHSSGLDKALFYISSRISRDDDIVALQGFLKSIIDQVDEDYETLIKQYRSLMITNAVD